jgi:phosphatidylinositol alpha-mannosyltransferase
MMLTLSKLAQTAMEKVSARIAVSEAARATLIKHVDGDAVVIPNGVNTAAFANAKPMFGWPGSNQSIVFLGRGDEPRKGLAVLVEAYPEIRRSHPQVRLLIAGPGEPADVLESLSPADRASVTVLGMVAPQDKASVLASGTIYVAPNTGGESFGIVLLEAMATGTPVVASDLEAFRRVLDNGRAGITFKNEDPADLALVVSELLANPTRRAELSMQGKSRAAEFDWTVVAQRVVDVYESIRVPGVKVEPDLTGQMIGRLGRGRITPESRND